MQKKLKEKTPLSLVVLDGGDGPLDSIEKCIVGRHLLLFNFKGGAKVEVYPHRVTFMDGGFAVIGEDVKDGSLTSVELEKVTSWEPVPSKGRPYMQNFSKTEIGDFIEAMRTVGGNAFRLVLKFRSLDQVQLNEMAPYFGNPFITSNPDGEYIWAATVEPCSQIFEWLQNLQGKIEIMDPAGFLKAFERFEKGGSANSGEGAGP